MFAACLLFAASSIVAAPGTGLSSTEELEIKELWSSHHIHPHKARLEARATQVMEEAMRTAKGAFEAAVVSMEEQASVNAVVAEFEAAAASMCTRHRRSQAKSLTPSSLENTGRFIMVPTDGGEPKEFPW